MNNKDNILKDLMKNQKKCCEKDKLEKNDLLRITDNVDKSLFGNECCLWNGYITNCNNNRAKYINFNYKNKKRALHRLLYKNFVGKLEKNEYLKYTCKHKGYCCNINHLKKVGNSKKTIKKNIPKQNITKIDNVVSFD
jgi:alpha-L-fucosidase